VGIAALTGDRQVFYGKRGVFLCLLTMLACSQPTISSLTHPDENLCANLITPQSF